MSSHANLQDLEQYISGQLSPNDSVLVQDHLDDCEECQLHLAEIAMRGRENAKGQETIDERRREPRIAVNFTGRLKQLDPLTSIGPPHDVQVIEVSASGLKIRTTRTLIPNTLVQIRFGGKRALGEVRYCIKTDTDCVAGIEQVPDFPSR